MPSHIEYERSYIFTHESARRFLDERGLSLATFIDIDDFYLKQNLRIRKLLEPDTGDVTYRLTHKSGEKLDGYRSEFEETISEGVAQSLISESVMTIKKRRTQLEGILTEKGTEIVMDFIDSPMRLAVLEIESDKHIPPNISSRWFNNDLRECSLSAFELFNRRVGICGGPSVGKSETSKMLSHILNVEFKASSFHVAEFATTFIQKYKKFPSFWEEFFIWHGQHEREHCAALSSNIIVSDCPTFLAYLYLLFLPKDTFSTSTSLVLSKMYKRVLSDISWYTDIIFLKRSSANPYSYNGIRFQTPEEAGQIESRIEQFLNDHNIHYKTYTCEQYRDILNDMFVINS